MKFAEVYQASLDARQEWIDLRKRYEAQYDEERTALFKRLYPKRKVIKFELLKDNSEADALWQKWQTAASDAWKRRNKEEEDFETRLVELAKLEEVPVTKFLGQVDRVYSSGYSTQTNPSYYAKNSAEAKADQARANGFQAEVKPIGPYEYISGTTYQDYGVFVNTTEIGWEMLKRRPGPGLKEWVRMCWKRGVNPRVYNPFLPPGIEEKLGLDYFGNEVAR